MNSCSVEKALLVCSGVLGWPRASPVESLCPGDANGDGVVDPMDVGFILSRLACDLAVDPDCSTADLNVDGTAGPVDVGFALSRFAGCVSFQPIFGMPPYFIEGTPRAVASADLEGDGGLEIIVTKITTDHVLVLKLDEFGQYSPFDTEVAGDLPFEVVAADLDGDGDSDVIVANALGEEYFGKT